MLVFFEILSLIVTIALAVISILYPDMKVEPWLVLSAAVLTAVEIARRLLEKDAWFQAIPPSGLGGKGGNAKVGGRGTAIGGQGGKGGVPGAGSGGAGGDAEVLGDGIAIGGEGGEAGQADRGGRGGRSALELLNILNDIKLPDGRRLSDFGRGGDGAISQKNPCHKENENKNE